VGREDQVLSHLAGILSSGQASRGPIPEAFADGKRVVLLITGHGLETVESLFGRPEGAEAKPDR
jgi:hypothetical protein